MRKFKKALMVFLSTVLCVTFCSMSALASGCLMYMDDGGGIAYNYMDAFGAFYTKNRLLAGNGWSYDNTTNTFILNGFNGSIFDFYDYHSYYDKKDMEFTIELADGSVNYITYPKEEKYFYNYALHEMSNEKNYSLFERTHSIFGLGKNVTIKGNGQLIIDSTEASDVYALHLWNGESVNLAPGLVISGGTSVGATEELTLGKVVGFTMRTESYVEDVFLEGLYLVTDKGTPATYVRICPDSALPTQTISAPAWKQDAVGWWVENPDGSYLVNSWYQSPESGLWYYMGADGYMLVNTTTPDGHQVGMDGAMIQ